MKTNSSSHILAFTQVENVFYWAAIVTDTATSVPNTPGLETLSGVPLGVIVHPIVRYSANSNYTTLVESAQGPDTAVSTSIGTSAW